MRQAASSEQPVALPVLSDVAPTPASQKVGIAEPTFAIEFLDPGAQAFAFTFG